MTKKTGYLGGTITVTGAAVSGASVKVVSGTTVVAEGIANENGIVTEKIDAGAYLIVITKKGYDEYKASTTVTDGKNIVVDAELLKSAEAGAVTSITNTRLYVTGTDLKNLKAADVKVTTKDGKTEIKVTEITNRADGTAFITTEAMTEGAAYVATVKGQDFSIIAKPADSTALKISSVDVVNNDMVQVTFDNTDADLLTLLDKANYSIDGDVTVKEVTQVVENGEKSTNKVYVKTSEQKAGNVYKLTVANVTDMAGNKIAANSSKQFAGKSADKTAPTLDLVAGKKGTKVTVTFSDASLLDEATLTNVANYTIEGLTVESVTVEKNKIDDTTKEVVLTTSAQTINKAYTLKVSNIADVYGNVIKAETSKQFTGTVVDTDAPYVISAAPQTNTSVAVTFNEELDAATATDITNYSIEGLTITKAELNSNSTTGNKNKVVTLTTSAQTEGTIYKVVVSNVKDEAQNVITSAQTHEAQFAGMKSDVTKPTVASVSASDKNTVVVKFSEAVKEENAKEALNYYIDGLGYPTAVKYATDKKSVTLTTPTQTSGKVYKVTVKNIADLSGNVIDTVEVQFAGLGDDLAAPKLSSVVALNKKQIQVTFNKPITGGSGALVASNFEVATKETTPTPKTINDVHLVDIDGNYASTYILTLDNDLDTGLYTLELKRASSAIDLGKTLVDFTGDESVYKATFGGVTSDAATPVVTGVEHIGNKKLRVTFDRELNSTAASSANTNIAHITLKYNDSTTVQPNGVAEGRDKNTLILTFTNDLKKNDIATLSFDSTACNVITDVTGENALTENNTAKDAYVTSSFATTDYEGAAKLALVSALSVDEQTLDLTFNREIDPAFATGSNASSFAANLKIKEGTTDVTLTNKSAKQTGANTVRVYFTPGTLKEGTLYTVDLSAITTEIADFNGALDKTVTATFGANTTKNEAPKLLSAVPIGDSTIQLTFSEEITGALNAASDDRDDAHNAGDDFIIYNKTTDDVVAAVNIANGATVTQSNTDKKVAYVTLSAETTKFIKGNTYVVEMLSTADVTDAEGIDTVVRTDATTTVSVEFSGAADVTMTVDPDDDDSAKVAQNNWATTETVIASVQTSKGDALAMTYDEVAGDNAKVSCGLTDGTLTFAGASAQAYTNGTLSLANTSNATYYVVLATQDGAKNKTVKVVEVTVAANGITLADTDIKVVK